MKHNHSFRGFTLLETLISLAIAVVVMGATLTARQVVQRNAQVSLDQQHITMLVNNVFSHIRLTRDTQNAASKTLDGDFPYQPLQSSDSAVKTYNILGVLDPSVTPAAYSWCQRDFNTNSTGCEKAILAESTYSPVSTNTVSLSATQILVGEDGWEPIAINRDTTTTADNSVQGISYQHGAKAANALLQASDVSKQAVWDFYYRKTTIRKYDQYSGEANTPHYVVTVQIRKYGEDVSSAQSFSTELVDLL